MSRKNIIIVVTATTSLLGILLLIQWFSISPTEKIELRVAKKEEITEKVEIEIVNIEGTFQKFNGVPSKIKGSWPRFRGANFDNINTEKIKIKEKWDKNGPPVLWSIKLGEGYAAPAVHNGRVYILDYIEKEEKDSLRCFSFDDGREIWRRSYKVHVKRNHGRSRTIPAVTDRYVVTIGPKCHVMCVDARTGAFLWGIDLVKDYGTKVPLWYTGQCPLIDGATAVIAPGGKSLLTGVDCRTGKVLWETPNPHSWQMSHSSIMPMTFYNQKFYVYCAIGGMVGVAATGPNRGKVLWETKEWNNSIIAPSPVKLPENRIFVTAGYGAGSMMFQVKKEGNNFSVKSLYRLEKEVFACEQQTPIYYRGYLFSILPNDAGGLKREAACLHPDGNLIWTSGKENRFGLGPFLIADNKIFILNDQGVLTLAKASIRGYIQLAQAKVLNGHDSWGPMALVKGRLLIRDFKRLVCLNVRAY